MERTPRLFFEEYRILDTQVNIVTDKRQDSSPRLVVASRISGCGMAVPEKVVTNDHFAKYLETSDEWIRTRTGIAERRWAEPDVSASELALPAAQDAIAAAGLSVDDIDGIVLATVTPDYVFPSTACFLQKRLGMTRGFAFDVNAVCSGFVYALTTANGLIKAEQAKNILVVGVDIYSRILDHNDRGTCVLFGDGAGAVVLSAVGEEVDGNFTVGLEGSAAEISGVYATELGSDGKYTEILCVPSGTANQATPESMKAGDHYLKMEGREVFKLAVRKLGEISESIVEKAGLAAEDVDYFVSHQANERILSSMAKHMNIPENKVLMNLAKYGNTSAASIPILLAEKVEDGTVSEGDLVLLSAFGGGVTWGVVLLRM